MTRLSFEGKRYDIHDKLDDSQAQLQPEEAIVFSGREPRTGVYYSVGVYNAFDSRAQYPVSTEHRQRGIPISGRSLLASGSIEF